MATDSHAVVTGGAGFLGSHLVDNLLEDGYQVTSVDNYGSGQYHNIEHIDSERFRSVEHDVRNPFPAFEEVDYVYHLASRASPADFSSYPVEIAMTNSVGSKNVFEFARRHDARVVLASTSEVYGDPEVHPQHEDYNGNVNLRGPRAPYDESKRFAEALAEAYLRNYDLDVRTVRIFNTYGPRMRLDDGRVIPTFLTQALADDDLTVYGDGSQTRSFCYVSDFVRGVRKYAEVAESDVDGTVVNLGSDREVTINQLAELVLDVIDTEAGITYEELPEDDPSVRCPDISRARELLDWESTVSLQGGLEVTASWFEQRS